jgi:hypothetical protein
MKLIQKFGDDTVIVKIYRDSEWNEFVCRLFVNGAELTDASYHTDDKQDAIDTAQAMWRRN